MTTSLADQLKQKGFISKEIQQFDVWSVADEDIDFPEERLGKSRQKHDRRFVIVLQNNKDNKDPTIKIISIAPLSTKSKFQRLDYLLKKKRHSFLRDDSFIRIAHIQPILKKDLKTKWGNINEPDIRAQILDRIFALFDLDQEQ